MSTTTTRTAPRGRRAAPATTATVVRNLVGLIAPTPLGRHRIDAPLLAELSQLEASRILEVQRLGGGRPVTVAMLTAALGRDDGPLR